MLAYISPLAGMLVVWYKKKRSQLITAVMRSGRAYG